MDHLAIAVDSEALDAAMERLGAAGVEFEGPVECVYDRTISFKDPTDVTIQFLAWHIPPPVCMQPGEALRRGQGTREAHGARIVGHTEIRKGIDERSAAGD